MGLFLMVNYTTKFIKKKDGQYVSNKAKKFIVSIITCVRIYSLI